MLLGVAAAAAAEGVAGVAGGVGFDEEEESASMTLALDREYMSSIARLQSSSLLFSSSSASLTLRSRWMRGETRGSSYQSTSTLYEGG